MLKAFIDKRQFHDKFHFFFDRKKNLNVVINLNFVELLKSKTSIPDSFIDNTSFLYDAYSLNLYLIGNGNDYYKKEGHKYFKKFYFLNKLQMFKNKNVLTNVYTLDVGKLKGKFKIKADLKFNYKFYNYVSAEIQNVSLSDDERSKFVKLKTLMDEENSKLFANKNNSPTDYFLESDEIDINFDKGFVSNLYDIYNLQITYDQYSSFITEQEEKRKRKYSGIVPITKFISSEEIYDLNFDLKSKTGNVENYEKLFMKLLQNVSSEKKYKYFAAEQSIFIKDEIERPQTKETIQSYETLGTGLESYICDNDLFNSIKPNDIKESDILHLATYLNNIKNFNINEFFINDLNLIPVSLAEFDGECEINYLADVDPISLKNTWLKLTKNRLENLQEGNYICKISSKNFLIGERLLETHFILVK